MAELSNLAYAIYLREHQNRTLSQNVDVFLARGIVRPTLPRRRAPARARSGACSAPHAQCVCPPARSAPRRATVRASQRAVPALAHTSPTRARHTARLRVGDALWGAVGLFAGFDFSAWLRAHASRQDFVVLKLNIEGAEYAVLRQMLLDGAFRSTLVASRRCTGGGELPPHRTCISPTRSV